MSFFYYSLHTAQFYVCQADFRCGYIECGVLPRTRSQHWIDFGFCFSINFEFMHFMNLFGKTERYGAIIIVTLRHSNFLWILNELNTICWNWSAFLCRICVVHVFFSLYLLSLLLLLLLFKIKPSTWLSHIQYLNLKWFVWPMVGLNLQLICIIWFFFSFIYFSAGVGCEARTLDSLVIFRCGVDY